MKIERLTFLIALLIGFAAGKVFAEEVVPVDLQVYYSKEDPNWPKTEKELDAVAKDYPALRIEKISIDDEKGYLKLTAVERDLKIGQGGDATLVFGPFYLVNRGEQRDIDMYFRPMVARVLKPDAGKGRLPSDPAGYAAQLFGPDVKLGERFATRDDAVRYFPVSREGKKLGWIVDAFQPIGCPICNDVQFLATVSEEFKLVDLRPVRDLERMGRPLEPKETTPFIGQFKGRTPESKADVDIISGATKTSFMYQNTINGLLNDLKKREQK